MNKYTLGSDVVMDVRATGVNAPARVQTLTSGSGISAITYDALGRVSKVVNDATGYSATYGYDAQGRLTTVTTNGVVRTITYNPNGTVASYI